MIYLDYSATTPVDDEVIDTYSRVCREFIGNPNSLHKLGLESKKLIDELRAKRNQAKKARKAEARRKKAAQQNSSHTD